MKLLFLPAIRVLDRLSYPLKFGLIILVCTAASAILLTQIFTNLRSEIRVTQQEIAGLELFDAGFAAAFLTGFLPGFTVFLLATWGIPLRV